MLARAHTRSPILRLALVSLGAVLLLVASLGGCRPAGTAHALTPMRRAAPDRLYGPEVANASQSSTLDALRRLRPEFVARRAAPLPTDPYGGYPVVYVDGVRLGALETLQGLSPRLVTEIRLLDASAGSHLVGVFHPGGVIAVRTARR